MIYVSLQGHDYEYEIGVLLKSFGVFNDISFVKKESLSDIIYSNNYLLVNNVVEYQDNYRIQSILYRDNKEIDSNESIFEYRKSDFHEKRKLLKRKIKLNIYDLISRAMNIKISWGILTGIRPTKIVHEYLDNDFTIDGIRSNLKNNYRLDEEKIDLLIDIAKGERKYIRSLDENLVSIYISIPYCPSRCVYCSFPSNPLDKGKYDVEMYLAALHKEIEGVASILNAQGRKIESVYIGGGTPTTLTSSQLDSLIEKIIKEFNIINLKEFTVEAGRPDTIDKEKLLVLKKNNVDRISINPQTMNEKTLRLIGRNHSVQDIKQSFYMAKEIGFNTINMDIIVGLPGEGIKEIITTLEEIRELNPENLTVHTLAIKRSSKLHEQKEDYKSASENIAIEMLNLTKKYASDMDLIPYYMYRQKYMVGNLENIGYTKISHECIYNIQIMEERQSIIALGAGGVSKIVYPKENRLERVPNVKSINDYIQRVAEMIDRKRIELTSNN